MTGRDSSAGSSEVVSPLYLALILVLVWAALAVRGFPFPNVDDALYTGAGLNMARGGALENPMVDGLGPFYIYPPLYFYMIDLWVRLWGTETASMVGLHVVLCWAFSWFTIRAFQILHREFLGWAIWAAMLLYSISVGMRPDNSGLFFISMSLYLAVCNKGRCRKLAALPAMLGCLCSPAALAFALPILVYLVFTEKKYWITTLVSGGVSLLLMALMVNWHVIGFLHGFIENSNEQKVGGAGQWLRENWYRPVGFAKFVLPIGVLVALIALACRRRGFRLIDAVIALGLFLGFYSSLHSISGHFCLDLIAVGGIGYYLYELLEPSVWRPILLGACGLIVMGSALRPLIQGVAAGQPKTGIALRNEVDALHPARLLVDQWSLRYVFDYRLRPGMISFRWSKRPFTNGPAILIKYPDECWVLSAEMVALSRPAAWTLDPEKYGLPAPRFATVFGHEMQNWVTNPGEMGISPPDESFDLH